MSRRQSGRAQRDTYHHGDLRASLIRAADAIIAEGGLEAFSLRTAAKRAGVSPAAPSHHFQNSRGLLTEVALLAFERLNTYLLQIPDTLNAVATIRALSLQFITFAMDHPGHFRLMFRHEMVNRDDERYAAASALPGRRLGQAMVAYGSRSEGRHGHFEDAARTLCGLATLQGLATLMIEEKATHFFGNSSSRQFLEDGLPRVLEGLYP